MQVIITDCDHTDIKAEEKVLQDAGISYKLLQCRTEDELIEQCGEAAVLINQYAPITERVLRNLTNVRLIIRYGVGVDNIDTGAATRLGVQVCNVPDYGMNEVADHAVALMLALLRKIPYMNAHTKNGSWNFAASVPLSRICDLTVGIVGLGRIGRAFAQRVFGFGCRIIGVDPYYEPNEQDGTSYIKAVSFEELIRCADVISLHIPADNAIDLIDERVLKTMKSSAYVINVARGGIINEAALDAALEAGEIAGAALDCMTKEPAPAGSSIFRHENLICTPHMAWYSQQAAEELKRKVAEQAVQYLCGETVSYPVNHI